MKHLKALDFPDADTANELAQLAPEDKQTMERIYRRSEEKFREMHEPPAETLTFQVAEERPHYFLHALAGLAACAVIGLGGWGLWRMSQHTPPIPAAENTPQVTELAPATFVPATPEQFEQWRAALFQDLLDKEILGLCVPGEGETYSYESSKPLTEFEQSELRKELRECRIPWTDDNFIPEEWTIPNTGDGVAALYLGDPAAPDTLLILRENPRIVWIRPDGTQKVYLLCDEEPVFLYCALGIPGDTEKTPAYIAAQDGDWYFGFNFGTNNRKYSLLAEQEQAFRQLLAEMEWQADSSIPLVEDIYGLDLENEERIYISVQTGAWSGYSIMLARDEQCAVVRESGGASAVKYRLPAENYDILLQFLTDVQEQALKPEQLWFDDEGLTYWYLIKGSRHTEVVATEPAFAPYLLKLPQEIKQDIGTQMYDTLWFETEYAPSDGESHMIYVR
ncbi:MAG: hypothetical protein IJ906_03150, partial [Oscillospiraceae bacterium]|nr:hypothetical protein [Oscillospiraceae bacterium]